MKPGPVPLGSLDVAEPPAPQTPDRALALGRPHHRPLIGVALLAGAVLLFACLDAGVKYLTRTYNVPLVVGARYFVNLLLMLALVAPVQKRRLVETRRTGLVVLRAASLAAASLFVGLALQRMPVAETTAVNFLAPIAAVLLAGPVLGERIGRIGLAAALAGFAGMLLIVRPGSGLDVTGVAFALCAVCANATYQLLSGMLGRSERTTTLLFYTTLVGSGAFALMLPWSWGGSAPSWWQLLLFISLGMLGGLGHYLFTAAYRYATAPTLAPLNYLQLLWAGLLGWLFFGDLPDALAVIGMCIVAASGAAIAVFGSDARSRLAT